MLDGFFRRTTCTRHVHVMDMRCTCTESNIKIPVAEVTPSNVTVPRMGDAPAPAPPNPLGRVSQACFYATGEDTWLLKQKIFKLCRGPSLLPMQLRFLPPCTATPQELLRAPLRAIAFLRFQRELDSHSVYTVYGNATLLVFAPGYQNTHLVFFRFCCQSSRFSHTARNEDCI